MSVSLPLPTGVRLLRSEISDNDKMMVLFLCMTARQSACPLCHRQSRRVHSRYWRSLADLPCMGTPVRWQLRIRRFFCDNPNCPRQTFSEALPSLASHHAQSTQRLREAQTCIGQAVGSRPGARVAQALHMPTSATTLLRLERSAPVPLSPSPRVLGVDDWAFRKGYRYGTILLDLERHHVVALLPDRSAQSLSEWLKDHPGVEIVSRDRAGVYADGARQGVPHAVQVADRFHLLKNGVEALERLVGRHYRQIQEAANKVQAQPTPQPSVLEEVPPTSAAHTRVQREKAQRREKRLARYQRIVDLQGQGASTSAIAETLCMSRRTVRRLLRAGEFLERAAAHPRFQPLDAFADYLHQRWTEGCHNAAQLWREIRERGFRGCQSALRPYLAGWRTVLPAELGRRRRQLPNAPHPQAVPSPRSTAWLLLGYATTRDAAQRAFRSAFVEELCAGCEEVKTGQRLVAEFFRIVRKRLGGELDGWLLAVFESKVPELMGFASGLAQDKAAIMAALTVAWNNGQTEGQVNRLKFLKRRGFGRANFDLLQQRVLQPS
jgi:transposase